MFTPGDYVELLNWDQRPESIVYEKWGNWFRVTDTSAMPGYDCRINHVLNGERPGDFSVKYSELKPLDKD